ncbi:MAG: hypothetical protein EP330_06980 [Deltaproteobacteria bacterium]|nr:MAG: hypothetical protein EP330_06980 [Deltaproteobacteria bacterium]
MSRIASLTALLALGTGCMTLDFMVFSAPTADSYDPDPEQIDPNLLDFVTFEASDGQVLHGAWYRPEGADAGRPPIIYFHGNSSNLNDLWPRIAYYGTWGYDVFAFDYRGFGMSEGPATFVGVFETDGLAAVEYVASETNRDPSEIPWMALSMGSGVAAHTNDEIDAQAVILQAMFPSTNLLADDGTGNDLPTGWFFNDEYDNLEATSNMTSPVFVMHGMLDDYINGPEYGPMVYDAAPEPKELWQPDDVAHADLFEVRPDEFRTRSLEWYGQFGSVPQ